MRKYLYITIFLVIAIQTSVLSQSNDIIYLDKIINTSIEIYYAPATVWTGDMYLFLCSNHTFIHLDSRTYASTGVWDNKSDTLHLYKSLEGKSIDKMVNYKNSPLFTFEPYPQKLIICHDGEFIIHQEDTLIMIYIKLKNKMLKNEKRVDRKILRIKKNLKRRTKK